MTPTDIFLITTETTADQGIYDRLGAANKDENEKEIRYSAIVKDGEGTLTFDNAGELNINQTFIAREGATVLQGKTTINSTTNGYPMLMVGGLNASLKLDGATYQTTATNSNNGSIVVGGRDGDGTLTLTSGATLKNNHGMFAGGQSRGSSYDNSADTFQHVCGSYVSKENTTLYRDSHKDGSGNTIYPNFGSKIEPWSGDGYERRASKATIVVEGGSKLQLGYGMYFCNADILLTGDGSELTEGHRTVSSSDVAYWSRWGDAVYGGTTITVKDGATLTAANNVLISTYGGSEKEGLHGDTKVTVGMDGTLNSLAKTYMGSKSYGAKTEFVVEAGGTANLTDVSAGFQYIPVRESDGRGMYSAEKGDIVTLTVQEGGQYNGSSLKLYEGSTMVNEGTITLTDGTMVTDSVDGVASASTEVKAQLVVDGGKMENKGTISIGAAVSTYSLRSQPAANVVIIDGEFVNSGSVEGAITMSGGKFVAEEGSTIGGLSATGGDIEIKGDVTMKGNLMLDGDADLIFEDPTATIDLGGYQLDLNGGNIAVTLTDEQLESLPEIVLFKGADVDDNLGSSTVSIYDASGNDTGKKANLSFTGNSNGDVVITVVPEPTTATLSLLALVGLAARRRRK